MYIVHCFYAAFPGFTCFGKKKLVEFVYAKGFSFTFCSSTAGIDLIAAFYGCLYAGVIPVTVRPPHPQNLAATLPTVRMIIDVSAEHAAEM